MVNIYTLIDKLNLAQQSAAPGIPTWVWILVGIILVLVVLGLVIGARTSERPSPTVRFSNLQEGTEDVSSRGYIPAEMIPQTGSDVLHNVAPPVDTVQDVEGPINNDDLTVIHGITPEIALMLIDSGITTFQQLAMTEQRTLENMMINSGLQYSIPHTWPEQARLADEGRWDELDQYKV